MTPDEPTPITREEFDRIFRTKSEELNNWRESLRMDKKPDVVISETVEVHTTAAEFARAIKEACDAGWKAACEHIADRMDSIKNVFQIEAIREIGDQPGRSNRQALKVRTCCCSVGGACNVPWHWTDTPTVDTTPDPMTHGHNDGTGYDPTCDGCKLKYSKPPLTPGEVLATVLRAWQHCQPIDFGGRLIPADMRKVLEEELGYKAPSDPNA